jgi:hypothetical protein
MTEKNTYTASVRRKGLEHTGVTEDVAKSMYHSLEKRTLFIGEVEHKRQSNDADTGRNVELVITTFEPSQDPALDDHLRQLLRTLHQNRVLHSEDQALDIEVNGDLEPSVDAVIAAQRAHEATQPHIFDPAEDGDACTICGEDLEHQLHDLDHVDDEPADQGPEPVDA